MNATVHEEAEQAPEDAQTVQEPEQDAQARPRNREAGYRHRLRETEAERDAIAQERDSLRQTLLEITLKGTIDVAPDLTKNYAVTPDGTPKPVAVQLREPSDLERFGVDLSNIWADGSLDRDALAQAVGDLYRQRPDLFDVKPPHGGAVPTIGLHPEGRQTDSFQDAVMGRRRG